MTVQAVVMAVVVMVQSGLLYESKIVITRNGEEVHGFDIIFNFFGKLWLSRRYKALEMHWLWGVMVQLGRL